MDKYKEIDLMKVHNDNYINFIDMFEVDIEQFIDNAEDFLKSYIALDRERLIYDNDDVFRNDVIIKTIRESYKHGLDELEDLNYAQVSFLNLLTENVLDKLLEI